MGIMWSYRQVRHYDSFLVSNITYLAICVSLNIFLTLMIIVRLALHSRNIRSAIGASPGPGNLYRAIITMLVESFALNAVGYILFILSISGVIFSTPLGEIQVRAVFHFLRHTATIPGHHLIIETDRRSLCSSLFCESQTGLR